VIVYKSESNGGMTLTGESRKACRKTGHTVTLVTTVLHGIASHITQSLSLTERLAAAAATAAAAAAAAAAATTAATATTTTLFTRATNMGNLRPCHNFGRSS